MSKSRIFVDWLVAALSAVAAVAAAYAAIVAARDGADFPAAVFAVVAILWALDAHDDIREARRRPKGDTLEVRFTIANYDDPLEAVRAIREASTSACVGCEEQG